MTDGGGSVPKEKVEWALKVSNHLLIFRFYVVVDGVFV